MIWRSLENTIVDRFKNTEKSVILYGPRQVGKTTLSKSIAKSLGWKTLMLNGDDKTSNDILSSQDLTKLERLVSGYQLIFIDEAQRIQNIGINMKLIIDSHPEIRILATGSSSFDLANKVAEPLTGRVWSYTLYPVSATEMVKSESRYDYSKRLEEQLLYGSYPEIYKYKTSEDKISYLKQLTTSYLYKDILEYADIKHADKIDKLLKLIALQLGNEVSLSELADNLNINRETVTNYIDLLKKSFVIFTLGGFNRNLRKEVTKMNKIYFYDLGVRNSIIGNFSPTDLRPDLGALFENYLIIERIKRNSYSENFANTYFWRLNTGAEIDYVEEKDGMLKGFEFKLNKKSSTSKKSWLEAYSEASLEVINLDNYLDFIL